MSKLDEILDWYTRPVNRVEFLDTRKTAVKDLMLDLVGETTLEISGGHYTHRHPLTTESATRDELIKELRQKIEAL